ncbi:hypothetical protein AB0M45_22485 [Nocardia sp. NPDC051787]|uniref:hypothetical protein n=1 Tax=Nocardia sp. NPDC051787 TaxID=3155415 RepID=UPI003447ED65
MARVTTTKDCEPDKQVGDVEEVHQHKGRQDGLIGADVKLFGHDITYRVIAATGPNGPEMRELTLDGNGRAIVSDDLRRVPVRRLAAAAVRAPVTFLTSDWERPEGARRGNQRLGDDHYRQVAEIARDAFVKGLPVREVVGRALHASPYTVDKWLRGARERGYLQRGELQRTTRRLRE